MQHPILLWPTQLSGIAVLREEQRSSRASAMRFASCRLAAQSPEAVAASWYPVWFCLHRCTRVERACAKTRQKLSRTSGVLSKLQVFYVLSNVSKGTGSAELPAPPAPKIGRAH